MFEGLNWWRSRFFGGGGVVFGLFFIRCTKGSEGSCLQQDLKACLADLWQYPGSNGIVAANNKIIEEESGIFMTVSHVDYMKAFTYSAV